MFHYTTLRELDFCLQLKSLVRLPLGVALSSIVNKRMITINSFAGLVPLPPFLISEYRLEQFSCYGLQTQRLGFELSVQKG